MSDNVTRRLTDREVATIIDSLVITRDSLREKGLTGSDCQTALDKLYEGIKPTTNGLTYMLGQHPSLIDVSEDGWLTRLDDCTDVNGHLSRATDHIVKATLLLAEMANRADEDGRGDDLRNLIEQITELGIARRITAEHITA
jgi:hypothetical protein